MSETQVTEGIRLNLIHLENLIMFAKRLHRREEFDDRRLIQAQISSLTASLEYSEKLFKQLYQKAAAYALRQDRVILEKE